MTKPDVFTTAIKIAEYLNLSTASIQSQYNQGKPSLYIFYKEYQLRFSDHCANPKNEQAIRFLGYKPLDMPNDFEAAVRKLNREMGGGKTIIPIGAIMNHPTYGIGIVIAQDLEKNKIDVRFGEAVKFFDAITAEDRGFLNLYPITDPPTV